MAPHGTAKAKSTGERCRRAAVTSKDKCRFHGGKTPVLHGLYSKYRDPRIAAHAAELVADEKLTDLRPLIADARARVERWLAEEKGRPTRAARVRDSRTSYEPRNCRPYGSPSGRKRTTRAVTQIAVPRATSRSVTS